MPSKSPNILSERNFVMNTQIINQSADHPARLMGFHNSLAIAADAALALFLAHQSRKSSKDFQIPQAVMITTTIWPCAHATFDTKFCMDINSPMWNSLSRKNPARDIVEKIVQPAQSISHKALNTDKEQLPWNVRYALSTASNGSLMLKYSADCANLSNHQRMRLMDLAQRIDAENTAMAA
jgi:hypothetical protein